MAKNGYYENEDRSLYDLFDVINNTNKKAFMSKLI